MSAETDKLEDILTMQIKISKVEENMVCVEFYKLEGSKHNFMKHFLHFRDQALDFANDRFLDSKLVAGLNAKEPGELQEGQD